MMLRKYVCLVFYLIGILNVFSESFIRENAYYYKNMCEMSCSNKCLSGVLNERSGCYCDSRCIRLGDCCVERERDCEGGPMGTDKNWTKIVLDRDHLTLGCINYGYKQNVRVVDMCSNEDISLKTRHLCENKETSFETLLPINFAGVVYKNMHCIFCNHPTISTKILYSGVLSLKCGQYSGQAYDVWVRGGINAFYSYIKTHCEAVFKIPYKTRTMSDREAKIYDKMRFSCNDVITSSSAFKACDYIDSKVNPVRLQSFISDQDMDVNKALCLRYKSNYLHDGKLYKNVHCAIVDSNGQLKAKDDFCAFIYNKKPDDDYNGHSYSFRLLFDFTSDHILRIQIKDKEACLVHDLINKRCLNITCKAGHMMVKDDLGTGIHCVLFNNSDYKQLLSWRIAHKKVSTENVELPVTNHSMILVVDEGGEQDSLLDNLVIRLPGLKNIHTDFNKNTDTKIFDYYERMPCNSIHNPMVANALMRNGLVKYADYTMCYYYKIREEYFLEYLRNGFSWNVEDRFMNRTMRLIKQMIFLNHGLDELEQTHIKCSKNKPKVYDTDDISLLGYDIDGKTSITRFVIKSTEQTYDMVHTPVIATGDVSSEVLATRKLANPARITLICEPELLNCETDTFPSNRTVGQAGSHYVTLYLETNVTVYVDNNSAVLLPNGDLVVCKYVMNITVHGRHASSISTSNLLMVILSLTGTVLSMMCLIFTLVTYAIFKTLRKGPGRSVMSLTISLFVAQLVFMIGPIGLEYQLLCTIFGILAHYSWLTTFSWMNIMAFDICMAFGTNKGTQFAENMKFVFYSLYAWGTPLVFILICILVDFTSHTITYGMSIDVCFIDQKESILYFFAFPVAISLVFNVISFSVTVVALSRTMNISKQVRPNGKQRSSIAIYARITSLMGFTWLFGFLANVHAIWFMWFPFIVFNTLQGVAIFVSFVLTSRARDLWKKKLHLLFHKEVVNPHRNNAQSIRKTIQARLALRLSSSSSKTMTTSCSSPTLSNKIIFKLPPSESSI